MNTPESIPEDRCYSFPCDCGGSISEQEDSTWGCDSCDFKYEQTGQDNAI